MSYDITKWKTIELKDLRIPVKTLFMCDREDWHPDIEYYIDDGKVLVSNCGNDDIIGYIKDDILHVTEIKIDGESSGTFMEWIIKPSLEQSKGLLIAKCIWEGGDSLSKIHVNDGVITETEMEF